MRKSFHYILILGKDYKDVMSSEVTENLQSSDSIWFNRMISIICLFEYLKMNINFLDKNKEMRVSGI